MDLTKKEDSVQTSKSPGRGHVLFGWCLSRHQLIPVPEQMFICERVLRECIPFAEG